MYKGGRNNSVVQVASSSIVVLPTVCRRVCQGAPGACGGVGGAAVGRGGAGGAVPGAAVRAALLPQDQGQRDHGAGATVDEWTGVE